MIGNTSSSAAFQRPQPFSLPIKYPSLTSDAKTPPDASGPTRKPPSVEDRRRGLEQAKSARAAQKAAWPAVNHPVSHTERFMRAILAHYGIRFIPREEPATPKRLMQILRRVGLKQSDLKRAVGCNAERFIEINPGRALYWLAGQALESYDLAVADKVLAAMDEKEEEAKSLPVSSYQVSSYLLPDTC